MRLFAVALSALPLTGLAVACAPRPRTQVTVIVDAEASVAFDAVRLRTRIEGGTAELLERNIEVTGTADDPVRFPVRASLIPLGGDATRRFRFEATAYDAAEQELGTVRALSSFSRGRTGTIRLVLEDCCRSVRCAVDETCRSCACVPAMTMPISEDAGTPIDAAVTRVDASFAPIDAAMPRDAGNDVGVITPDAYSEHRTGCSFSVNCIEITPAAISRQADTMLGPIQCQRPIAGACPSSVAPGTYGCDIFRIYNPRSASVSVTLRTNATYDTFLAVYRDDAADVSVFPTPPTAPAACEFAVDNTPGVAPDASVTFTMPPGSVYKAVMTTTQNTDMGDATFTMNVL